MLKIFLLPRPRIHRWERKLLSDSAALRFVSVPFACDSPVFLFLGLCRTSSKLVTRSLYLRWKISPSTLTWSGHANRLRPASFCDCTLFKMQQGVYSAHHRTKFERLPITHWTPRSNPYNRASRHFHRSKEAQLLSCESTQPRSRGSVLFSPKCNVNEK